MKPILKLLLPLSLFATACGQQETENSLSAQDIEGKQIYVPKDLADNLVNNPSDTSSWSYRRMSLTENFAIFWQKGFGDNLDNPPDLHGKNMSVNLQNLQKKLEYFYGYYRDTLKFVGDNSLAEKYRMMIMLWYSLEGTAYGGDYDQKIGAFWVAPNRIQDTALNCVAHELGHSFQMQAQIDKGGLTEDNYWDCGPFYEMTSQFMLWRVNPDWIRDEKYHWDAFRVQTFKAFLSWENAYHSPYVLEFWAEKRGADIIAKMFQNAQKGEDAVDVYKRLTGISQEEFCKEMLEANCRILNLDFKHAYHNTRQYVLPFSTKMHSVSGGYMQVDESNRPENYGFNAIEIDFRGKETVNADLVPERNENVKFYTQFVGIDNDGKAIYGDVDSKTFKIPDGGLKTLYYVVMPAPKTHFHNVADPETQQNPNYGYKIKM